YLCAFASLISIYYRNLCYFRIIVGPIGKDDNKWLNGAIWSSFGLGLDIIWAGHFWCLNGVRHVLKSGKIKVEAWKARNYTSKRNPNWRGTLSYLIQHYLILPPAARRNPNH
ncbi:hypothetical protein KJ032_26905, partial [Salmonella enterica subsp. enterica serovar Typhimurium]|nr:hypothetical protein [Salmonella enterica subsp. enterica serovar Typhimurium]